MSEELKTLGQWACESYGLPWQEESPSEQLEWEAIAKTVIAEHERRHPEKAMAGELAENLEHLLMAIEGNRPGDEDAAYYLCAAKDTSGKLLSRLDAARKGQPVPHHCPAITELNDRLHERTQGAINSECRVREELRIERARCQNYRAENTEMHRTIRQLEEENSLLRARAEQLRDGMDRIQARCCRQFSDGSTERADAIIIGAIKKIADSFLVAPEESPAAEAQELNPL